MNASWPDEFRRILAHPQGALEGLVDELLALSCHHHLRIHWQVDRILVRAGQDCWHDLSDAAPRKAVFRAILARIAALCGKSRGGAASPYGGQGVLVSRLTPATEVHVEFENTPQSQRLELNTQFQAGTQEQDSAALNGASLDDVPSDSPLADHA